MRQRLLTALVILAVCAVLGRLAVDRSPPSSPFSISGVKLGMTRAQVHEKLGPPDAGDDGHSTYFHERGDCFVTFSAEGLVIGVRGNRLELGAIDYTPEDSHGKLSAELWEFLGEEDWKDGEKHDFAHNWGYDEFALVVQRGCTGWYFFLGKRW